LVSPGRNIIIFKKTFTYCLPSLNVPAGTAQVKALNQSLLLTAWGAGKQLSKGRYRGEL